MESAVILSACRTPVGTFGGVFKTVSAADLGAVAIRESIARAGIDAGILDDVIMGCVLQAGAGMNVARQAAMRAGVPASVPAVTVNRVCGSGLQAVIDAAQAIAAGSAQAIVAGGAESMSSAPYLLRETRWGARMGHVQAVDSMLADGLTCALEGCHMGETAEQVATLSGVTREAQDAFAAESQRRANQAIRTGAFRAEIAAVEVPAVRGPAVVVDADEHPRADSTVEVLARLRPAFRQDGTVTAGNASGINDGAAALVVTSEARARELGRTPLARIVAYAVAGVDPIVMGLGPIPAVRRALDRAGWSVRDIDLFELNEAFAAQSLAVIRELDLDPARVNVRGGAIALGHPIGASGARILTTLIHALRDRGEHRGVATLCIGGGQGIALAIEM
ncbi:MAG: acetyl-CoA C-acetyltransferase [Chloroflexota bacterium]|jgi:acetyl-CoA C-acetyltransferase|nr:acetyl-CoA C-acetyltransferase [Chloroflexota bacterium]